MTEAGETTRREQRQVARKYLVFYLRVFDGLSVKVLGHVVNLSSKGLMLLSDSIIPVNAEYRLRMRMPIDTSEQAEIVFNATSRWCRPDENPDFFLTGFQLHNLSDACRGDILALLDEYSYMVE